jgi:hypothetical protein
MTHEVILHSKVFSFSFIIENKIYFYLGIMTGNGGKHAGN